MQDNQDVLEIDNLVNQVIRGEMNYQEGVNKILEGKKTHSEGILAFSKKLILWDPDLVTLPNLIEFGDDNNNPEVARANLKTKIALELVREDPTQIGEIQDDPDITDSIERIYNEAVQHCMSLFEIKTVLQSLGNWISLDKKTCQYVASIGGYAYLPNNEDKINYAKDAIQFHPSALKGINEPTDEQYALAVEYHGTKALPYIRNEGIKLILSKQTPSPTSCKRYIEHNQFILERHEKNKALLSKDPHAWQIINRKDRSFYLFKNMKADHIPPRYINSYEALVVMCVLFFLNREYKGIPLDSPYQLILNILDKAILPLHAGDLRMVAQALIQWDPNSFNIEQFQQVLTTDPYKEIGDPERRKQEVILPVLQTLAREAPKQLRAALESCEQFSQSNAQFTLTEEEEEVLYRIVWRECPNIDGKTLSTLIPEKFRNKWHNDLVHFPTEKEKLTPEEEQIAQAYNTPEKKQKYLESLLPATLRMLPGQDREEAYAKMIEVHGPYASGWFPLKHQPQPTPLFTSVANQEDEDAQIIVHLDLNPDPQKSTDFLDRCFDAILLPILEEPLLCIPLLVMALLLIAGIIATCTGGLGLAGCLCGILPIVLTQPHFIAITAAGAFLTVFSAAIFALHCLWPEEEEEAVKHQL